VSKTPPLSGSRQPLRNASGLVASFYGDDFTGSTDVMEAFVRNGFNCVLFLDVPTTQDLDQVGPLDVIGVAGMSRSWSPEEMDSQLPQIFQALHELAAPLFHYKICSTFDSAPDIGSIGRALDIAHDSFGPQTVPLVVGAPILKRYTVFGHLFATAGDVTHRIDRHPTMAFHPVTPMTESDLLRHLAHQTKRQGAGIDFLCLLGPSDEVDRRVDELVSQETSIVHFDVLENRTLEATGRQLARMIHNRWSDGNQQTVVFGSSGVEYGLATWWESREDDSAGAETMPDFPVAQTLAVVGSRSPATTAQVDQAREAGFVDIGINPVELLGTASAAEGYRRELSSQIIGALKSGKNVVVTTPEKSESIPISGKSLATASADIVRTVFAEYVPRRLIVAGGDTSGHVARALEIHSLKISRLLTPGAPLCTATLANRPDEMLDVCLKGGQVGAPDYFVRIAGLGAKRIQSEHTSKERVM